MRMLIVAVMGLGLGLGVTVTVLSAPDSLHADSLGQETTNNSIAIKSVSVPSIGFVADMDSQAHPAKSHTGTVVSQIGQGTLGNSGSIFITSKGFFSEIPNLEIVTLGDEVRIIGTNNGLYRYSVVALRTIPYSEVTKIAQDISEEVIIFSRQSVLSTEAQVVVATRVQ